MGLLVGLLVGALDGAQVAQGEHIPQALSQQQELQNEPQFVVLTLEVLNDTACL